MTETKSDGSQDVDPKNDLVWRIGILDDTTGQITLAGDRALGDAEIAAYRQAMDFIMSRQAQTGLKLVIGNYREFRALEAATAIAHTSTKSLHLDAAREATFHLKRVLLNWLNSIRLLDDHACAHVKRLYGQREMEAYNAARKGEYDNNLSYRFMYELRNYAQHVGEVPLQCTITANQSETRLELFFSRDDLLNKFDNWKSVKADLIESPERILLDDHLEAAMHSPVALALKVGEIDQPRFEESADTIKRILGEAPENPKQKKTIFRTHEVFALADGSKSMNMDMLQTVTFNEVTGEGSPTFSIPDFRQDRPVMSTAKQLRDCQGPIDRVAGLPAENCDKKATMVLYFAHQEGIAFMFGCDEHAVSLAQWAGTRFGGCYAGEIGKLPHLLTQASKLPTGLHMPHGEEFLELVKMPGAPVVNSLFDPDPKSGEEGSSENPSN